MAALRRLLCLLLGHRLVRVERVLPLWPDEGWRCERCGRRTYDLAAVLAAGPDTETSRKARRA